MTPSPDTPTKIEGLRVPANRSETPTLFEFTSTMDPTGTMNPYFLARHGIDRINPDSVFCERVHINNGPVLPANTPLQMFVDENGWGRQRPYNERATEAFYPFSPGIVGDVVILAIQPVIVDDEPDEAIRPFHTDELELLRTVFASFGDTF